MSALDLEPLVGQRFDEFAIRPRRNAGNNVRGAPHNIGKHPSRLAWADVALHVLVDSQQQDDIVFRQKDIAEAPAAEIQAIEPGMHRGATQQHLCSLDMRLGNVDPVDRAGFQLGYLIGDNTHIAANIENGFSGVVDLCGE
ncbi:hypothetical protein NKJ20_30095 [Mesorhizobium sp. M0185]